MESKKLVLLLISMNSLFSSLAYDFYVGGKDGWVSKPSESYDNWSQRNRFSVNDTLVFKYKSGADSVLVVGRGDYDSCNTASPILKFEDGDSKFMFDRSGPFYFISGIQSNCLSGQKLHIIVLAPRGNKSPPSAPPPNSVVPTPTGSPPSPQSAAPTPTTGSVPSPQSTPPAPSPTGIAPPPQSAAPTPSGGAPSPQSAAPTPAPSPSGGAPSPQSATPAPSPTGSAPSPQSVAPTPAPSPSGGAPSPQSAAPAPSPTGSAPSPQSAAPAPSSGGAAPPPPSGSAPSSQLAPPSDGGNTPGGQPQAPARNSSPASGSSMGIALGFSIVVTIFGLF